MKVQGADVVTSTIKNMYILMTEKFVLYCRYGFGAQSRCHVFTYLEYSMYIFEIGRKLNEMLSMFNDSPPLTRFFCIVLECKTSYVDATFSSI